METKQLKKYAPEARREFIEAVANKAAVYGLLPDEVLPMQEEGDVVIIGDRPFPRSVAKQRKELEARIRKEGFQQFIEAVAYTWFNRFVAIRYMELHGYLDHGYRVLSHPEGNSTPEILENAERIELPGLNRDEVVDLKLDGSKDEQLYQMLLLAQCNALHKAMPFLFESIKDGTELLLPDNLLHTDSLVRTMVNDIPEEQWQNVEIIGWLYQFYISEKKDEVIGKVVKSEDIPAATQLFTPNWIVKYLVQNSLGRQWVATYPDSPLKQQMEFYIEPAEQTPEVQQQLDEITPESLNPEELTLLDPACGSGHILVEAYDLFKAIYEERGYRARDIPKLILTKNLFGLEIDDRAAQLSAFSLMMKARADDRGVFGRVVQPNVLSIQESKGLDAKEITEALNEPILKEKLPPSRELFEEIADDKSPLFSRKNLSVKGGVAQDDLTALFNLFDDGKTFGSLLQVPESLANNLPSILRRIEDVSVHGGMFQQAAARSVLVVAKQATFLARQYTSVVMNPPYMGARGGMNASLKEFANTTYPLTCSDLFSAFIERGLLLLKPTGQLAMITMQSWMFLSSFEEMRDWLLSTTRLTSMAHFGPRAFSTISGEVVQVAAFVIEPVPCPGFRPTFHRLIDGNEEQKKNDLLARKAPIYNSLTQHELTYIPGSPIAYWANPVVTKLFNSLPLFGEIGETLQGMTTCDNDFYLRFWWEVSHSKIGIGYSTREYAACTDKKWFPYTKGGSFRKWFGNDEYLVNWEDDGHLLRTRRHPTKDKVWAHNFNLKDIFREGATYSSLSSADFGCRYTVQGSLFDQKGSMIFVSRERNILPFIALFNSSIVAHITEILCPTLDFNPGSLLKVPVHPDVDRDQQLEDLTNEAIRLSQADWNLSETAPAFQRMQLVEMDSRSSLSSSWGAWDSTCSNAVSTLRSVEQSINQRLLELYELQGEISGDVSDDQITLSRPERKEDSQRLISYTIGCMMGRYSLDARGLIYAHSGNESFDPGEYSTFPADDDGIIPLTDIAWFLDDATHRFEQFIKTAWPEEHLEENLKFVAESLGQKKDETYRDCIRRYLATGFYKHHLSMYKKRPIYWLFSSGKQRAFQCLVYLHRYNAGTLSRMRTEYVVKLQGMINTRIEQLEDDIPAAGSTSHRKKLEKERDKLIKQREELQTFDEKLRHCADLRIELDLDNGVKVNYGKFGDLLAEVKAITGKKPEVLA